MSALNKIKKAFPQVEELVDSKKTIVIKVSKEDAKLGRKKQPESCALARACLRQKIADAAIIGLCYSYLIKGKRATRFVTSEGVQREITSFDRTHYFAQGNHYKLSKVPPSGKIGHRENRSGRKPAKNHNGASKPKHYTSNVRLVHQAPK